MAKIHSLAICSRFNTNGLVNHAIVHSLVAYTILHFLSGLSPFSLHSCIHTSITGLKCWTCIFISNTVTNNWLISFITWHVIPSLIWIFIVLQNHITAVKHGGYLHHVTPSQMGWHGSQTQIHEAEDLLDIKTTAQQFVIWWNVMKELLFGTVTMVFFNCIIWALFFSTSTAPTQ